MAVTNNAALTPNYTTQSIFYPGAAEGQQSQSGFRRVFGAIAGGVGNLVAPGLGSIIGSAIGGFGGGFDPEYFLQQQIAIQQQQREFELKSTILKVRHDMAMSSIRNMK